MFGWGKKSKEIKEDSDEDKPSVLTDEIQFMLTKQFPFLTNRIIRESYLYKSDIRGLIETPITRTYAWMNDITWYKLIDLSFDSSDQMIDNQKIYIDSDYDIKDPMSNFHDLTIILTCCRNPKLTIAKFSDITGKRVHNYAYLSKKILHICMIPQHIDTCDYTNIISKSILNQFNSNLQEIKYGNAIEIVKKHVHDPEILNNILTDMDLTSNLAEFMSEMEIT